MVLRCAAIVCVLMSVGFGVLAQIPATVTPGSVYLVAGGGSSGDGVGATSSNLLLGTIWPYGFNYFHVDQRPNGSGRGHLYVAIQAEYRVRLVNYTTGNISTVLGTGTRSTTGNGGPGKLATMGSSNGVVRDPTSGLLLISTENGIRSLSPEGIVEAFRGLPGGAVAVAFDTNGGLLTGSGSSSTRVLRYPVPVTTSTAQYFACNGVAGIAGDGGPATSAQIMSVAAICVDTHNGDVFIVDSAGNKVRKVAAATGIITTVAGTGNAAFSGDGGPAALADLSGASSCAVDAGGNLFIADYGNARIRRVDATAGIITTFVAAGTRAPTLSNPNKLLFDAGGHLFFSEGNPANTYKVSMVANRVCGPGYTNPPDLAAASATACTIAPAGYYSPGDRVEPIPCPPGRYGSIQGLTNATCSGPCPAGYYCPGATSVPLACTLPSMCPEGSIIPSNTATASASRSRSPAATSTVSSSASVTRSGNASPSSSRSTDTTRSASASISASRSAAATASHSGSATLSASASMLATASPSATATASNWACPAGYLQDTSSATSVCSPCLAGTHASTSSSTECKLCDPGTIAPWAGMAECLPCDQGSYWPLPGGYQCSLCPAGSASNVSGALSVATCRLCSPGHVATSPGASSCSPCPPGSFAERAGSSTCSLCPRSTYSTFEAATSSSTCVQCPGDTTTLIAGASSPADCVAGTFSCPAGTQLAALGTTRCVSIQCPPPLMRTGNGCAGCPAGTTGTPGACRPCSAGQLCPGMLSRPLLNSSSSCTSDSAAVDSLPAGMTQDVVTILPPIIAGALVVLVVTLMSFIPAGSALLKRVDAFALRYPEADGAGPVKASSSSGGVCTVAGACTVAVLAAVLALRRSSDNILAQSSLAVLNAGALQAAAGAAWATAAAAGGLQGLTLRIIVDGEQGACASPLSWSASGLQSGAWALASAPAACGDGRTLLTFSCPSCIFTGSSSLTLSLDYSCQAMVVDAAAVDAGSAVSVVQMPVVDTTATPASLLASATWELAPLASIQRDTITGAFTRGYQLVGIASSASFLPTPATIRPLEAAVTLRVVLTLQTLYSFTLLSEKTSIIQLLSSIVGLTGIFGAFGLGYRALSALATRRPCPSCAGKHERTAGPRSWRRGGGSKVLGGETAAEASCDSVPTTTMTTNPLAAATPQRRAAAVDANSWCLYQDSDGDVYYVNLQTGESMWTLPPSATIVASTAS